MNLARIQNILARPDLDVEVDALLRELAAPGGAIAIADQGAWEMVCSESILIEIEGEHWYQIQSTELTLDLGDSEEAEIARSIVHAVNYLARRELIEYLPEHPSLIRLKEERP